ncbi:MAG: NYN domain-containing protein [Chloroflexi bacterium]|nr:NYN domain-containing protein [Chloroflexota bacterium]
METKKPGRSRRGRRGGVGRKRPLAKTVTDGAQPAAAAPAARNSTRATPVEAPARATPPARPAARPQGGGPLTLEAMIARQDVFLQDLGAQQAETLKALQGSLSSIEHRLLTLAGQATERPRVAIFVDVPNVMYAADRMKVKLNYKKMLDFLVRGRELVRASAYAPISDDAQKRLDTQKFVQPFDDMGYRVVTKPHKRYADGSMKANFDVELAIDVLTMSDRLDIVTLV